MSTPLNVLYRSCRSVCVGVTRYNMSFRKCLQFFVSMVSVKNCVPCGTLFSVGVIWRTRKLWATMFFFCQMWTDWCLKISSVAHRSHSGIRALRALVCGFVPTFQLLQNGWIYLPTERVTSRPVLICFRVCPIHIPCDTLHKLTSLFSVLLSASRRN